MRYRLQRHDGTDCSATMVPITVLRMVPIQRYRQVKDGKAWIFDKEAFDTLNPGTGLPYGYKLKQKEHEYTIAKEAV